jgi:glycosyltransferase involved in cell wall biosynthesis
MVGKICSCDIVVNPIVKGSAASIINKVGDYALSGLPVINTQECEEYRTHVATRGCGINCAVGNANEVADAIEQLALNPDMRKRMGAANRRFAEECFDRRSTYSRILSFIAQ